MIIGGTVTSRHRPLPASHASDPSSQAATNGAARQTMATISDDPPVSRSGDPAVK